MADRRPRADLQHKEIVSGVDIDDAGRLHVPEGDHVAVLGREQGVDLGQAQLLLRSLDRVSLRLVKLLLLVLRDLPCTDLAIVRKDHGHNHQNHDEKSDQSTDDGEQTIQSMSAHPTPTLSAHFMGCFA